MENPDILKQETAIENIQLTNGEFTPAQVSISILSLISQNTNFIN